MPMSQFLDSSSKSLLPFVDKKPDGTRIFKDEDFKGLEIITCMKNSGMPIKDIKKYMDLCQEGDSTLQERLDIFFERKEAVQEQLAELNKVMETINHKYGITKQQLRLEQSQYISKTKSMSKLENSPKALYMLMLLDCLFS